MHLNIPQMADCNCGEGIPVYSASSNDTSVCRRLCTLCFLVYLLNKYIIKNCHLIKVGQNVQKTYFCKLEVLYCLVIIIYLGSGFIRSLSYTLCAKIVQMCYSQQFRVIFILKVILCTRSLRAFVGVFPEAHKSYKKK